MSQKKESNRIDISSSDLYDHNLQPRIVVEVDEQQDLEFDTPIASWFYILASIIGGFFALMVTELSYNGYTMYHLVFGSNYYRIDLFVLVISGIYGTVLGAVPGVHKNKVVRTIAGNLLGLVFGLCGGILASGFNNFLMEIMNLTEKGDLIIIILMRGLSWSLVGVMIGLGISIIGCRAKQVIRFMVAGFTGALIGGVIFSMLMETFLYQNILSRGVSILILGLCLAAGFVFANKKVNNLGFRFSYLLALKCK